MSKPTKPSDGQQSFATESPGKEPQSLHLILSQFAAQFRDLSAMARAIQLNEAVMGLESEVDALQLAIDKVRGARETIGIVLRSMAYTTQDARDKQHALDSLLASLKKAIHRDPEIKASELLAALEKGAGTAP